MRWGVIGIVRFIVGADVVGVEARAFGLADNCLKKERNI